MNLSERLRKIVETMTPSTRRFVALEEATQISAKTWQTWWSRGGKASADMIQAVGQIWPHFAFWLVTGVTDHDHGHTSPDLTWLGSSPKRQREQAEKLFSTLIEIRKYSDEKGEGEAPVPTQLIERERYLRQLRGAEERLLSELDKKDQEGR